MRSLETIKAINKNPKAYKPAKLPKLEPWDKKAATRAVERRKRLNGKS